MNQKLFIPVLASLLFTMSCGWRVTTNGQKIPLSPLHPIPDTILVLPIDTPVLLPPEARLLGTTHIRSPLQINYGQDQMIPYAMQEAARLGGNIIQLTRHHGITRNPYIYSGLYFEVYSIDPSLLPNIKARLDSAVAEHRDSVQRFCIVHVEVLTIPWLKDKLYFNDSLVSGLKGTNTLHPAPTIDLTLTQKGILSIGPLANSNPRQRIELSNPRQRIELQPGKEYFIACLSHLGRQSPTYNFFIQGTKSDYEAYKGGDYKKN
jgi:hypothetical protein